MPQNKWQNYILTEVENMDRFPNAETQGYGCMST